jgi:hypothetical protein
VGVGLVEEVGHGGREGRCEVWTAEMALGKI